MSSSDRRPEEGRPNPEIGPEELNNKLEKGKKFFILDVREPREVDICSLDNDMLIPVGELPERLEELPVDEEIVIYCRTGQRSALAQELLLKNGFETVYNLKGGIRAWAKTVADDMETY